MPDSRGGGRSVQVEVWLPPATAILCSWCVTPVATILTRDSPECFCDHCECERGEPGWRDEWCGLTRWLAKPKRIRCRERGWMEMRLDRIPDEMTFRILWATNCPLPHTWGDIRGELATVLPKFRTFPTDAYLDSIYIPLSHGEHKEKVSSEKVILRSVLCTRLTPPKSKNCVGSTTEEEKVYVLVE